MKKLKYKKESEVVVGNIKETVLSRHNGSCIYELIAIVNAFTRAAQTEARESLRIGEGESTLNLTTRWEAIDI